MAQTSSQALFPRKERQASKRRCRRLPWQTFLSLEPLEHRLMLDGTSLVGNGGHADRPDLTPAYIGSIQPSNSENLKADGLNHGASPASSAASPLGQNAGATKADTAKVETANPQSDTYPTANAQPSGVKLEASKHLTPSMPAVNADAATVHFSQLGNDATFQSNAPAEASYPEGSKQGIDLAKAAPTGSLQNGRPDNGFGEAASPLHAVGPQITSSSRSTTQAISDRSVVLEPGGAQLATAQHFETQPPVTTPSIVEPAASGMRPSDDPVNGIASAGLQTSQNSLAVGEEVILNQQLQQEVASARNAQPIPPPTAAISAKSLTQQSGFVDMIFASIGHDTAKGLKSLSQEPLDPWILRGVVIQPANPVPQDKGSSRSETLR